MGKLFVYMIMATFLALFWTGVGVLVAGCVR